jgi:hypothetical protein
VKREERTGRRILVAIVVALAVWGLVLAVGAYLGLWHQVGERGGLRDPRRFWIVFGVVAMFLLFWGAALAMRAKRNRE